jgi:acetyl esterase
MLKQFWRCLAIGVVAQYIRYCVTEIQVIENKNHRNALRVIILVRESFNQIKVPSIVDKPYIDAQVLPIIENMKKMRQQNGPISDVAPEIMRVNFTNDVKVWNAILPDMPANKDFSITTSFGEIPVRLYDPEPELELLPTMIFIHGGGWIVGDLDTNERFLRLLSLRSGLRILSIDYPLAPENPFPVALNCNVEIIKQVRKEGKQWGIDSNNLCIGGDSAGANLALSVALDLKNEGEGFLKQLTLIYGAFSSASDKPSFKVFGQGDYGMGAEAMNYFWGLYVGDSKYKTDPRAAPLLADVSDLPQTDLYVAGLDPLQDDSVRLSEKLRSACVKYSLNNYPGMIHGFVSLCGMIEQGDIAITEMANKLVQIFKTNSQVVS